MFIAYQDPLPFIIAFVPFFGQCSYPSSVHTTQTLMLVNNIGANNVNNVCVYCAHQAVPNISCAPTLVNLVYPFDLNLGPLNHLDPSLGSLNHLDSQPSQLNVSLGLGPMSSTQSLSAPLIPFHSSYCFYNFHLCLHDNAHPKHLLHPHGQKETMVRTLSTTPAHLVDASHLVSVRRIDD